MLENELMEQRWETWNTGRKENSRDLLVKAKSYFAATAMWSVAVHHKLSGVADIELQRITVAPCDEALIN